ncbi:Acyl-coenzyme A oxidase [Abortiporus biennis]
MTGTDFQNKKDMLDARERANFDITQIRNFIHGGKNDWDAHHSIVQIMSNDPTFDKSLRVYMSRSDRYKRGLKMMNRIIQLRDEYSWSPAQYSKAVGLADEPLPLNLHDIAFQPVFMAQASPELLKRFGKLIESRGIVGCYLQTELGHGSNVAALETTAIFIPETQQFEIHSPTLTSTKWWIGSLGLTSTHGVLQAKLILGGKDLGPHLFLVPLRSLIDHSVLPGITIGDIGPKAMNGYTAVDNGFARFDHPPHAKISYGGMLYIRSSMVTSAGWTIAKAITIAVRYATVRRQGGKDSQGLENQIITYPSVYYRLLPILAHAYVFILLGRNLSLAFSEMSNRLASGDTSLLAEMHATTSGLKVLVTATSTHDIETARRALGGHGFSAYAGIGRIYADNLPSVTYEGDNYLLDQQVVRAAVKAYHAFTNSASSATVQLTPSTNYLRTLVFHTSETSFDWNDSKDVVRLLQTRAAKVVQQYARQSENLDASADQRVSRAVTDAFVAQQVQTFISALSGELPGRESLVLTDLFRLHLLTVAESALVDILSFNLLPTQKDDLKRSGEDPTWILRAEIKSLCLKLLPQAIGLTDAFGFTDWELDSALGVSNGDVYKALWDAVQTEPLNKTHISEGYEEYLKPLLERSQRYAAKL